MCAQAWLPVVCTSNEHTFTLQTDGSPNRSCPSLRKPDHAKDPLPSPLRLTVQIRPPDQRWLGPAHPADSSRSPPMASLPALGLFKGSSPLGWLRGPTLTGESRPWESPAQSMVLLQQRQDLGGGGHSYEETGRQLAAQFFQGAGLSGVGGPSRASQCLRVTPTPIPTHRANRRPGFAGYPGGRTGCIQAWERGGDGCCHLKLPAGPTMAGDHS